MKAIKTIAIVSLIAMLGAVNAQAWGKKEQGILIGAGAALLLPPLLQAATTPRYSEPVRYVEQPMRYTQRVEQPRVIYVDRYIDRDERGFSHRTARGHNYINNQNQGGDRIIIEHADGTRTIIDR
ncbi:MAG: hypothetical protein LBS73_00690 [Campylobacteraceae bacterium]|jgi:hypothetical protein|nr:hypothetical protein [Campylobacteraceae bacterium]